MTTIRVQKAAALRGMKFSGEKKFRNTWAGRSYEIVSPDGRNFLQSDTLMGIYRFIMRYPLIKKGI